MRVRWPLAGFKRAATAGTTYQVARAWAQDDPEAIRAEQQVRQQVRDRYGVDLDATGDAPAAVREAVERATRRHDRSAGGTTAPAVEHGEVVLLMVQADAADRAADRSRSLGRDTTVRYDSPARRDAMAADLQAAGVDNTTAGVRTRADVSQAKPAAEATRSTG